MGLGKETIVRIKQIPRYPVDIVGMPRVSRFINRPVVRWNDPRPEELQRNSTRIFVTGHSVDHDWGDRPSRFPDTLQAVNAASEKINEKLDWIAKQAEKSGKNLELVMCSATAGTDLLALEWALNKIDEAEKSGKKPTISVRAFLGYDTGAFIKDSVDIGIEEHKKRWLKTFTKLQAKGLVVEPEFRGRRRQRRNPDPITKQQIKSEVALRYGTHEGHYKVLDELNDRMVQYLRKGDFALVLWDGKEPRGRGGTLDAIDKAFRRIRDESHVLFVEDPTGEILPNKAPYAEGENRRTLAEAQAMRRRLWG